MEEFVDKRDILLQQILEELDTHSRAALAFVYMRNGQLESPIEAKPSELDALGRLGSDLETRTETPILPKPSFS